VGHGVVLRLLHQVGQKLVGHGVPNLVVVVPNLVVVVPNLVAAGPIENCSNENEVCW